MTSNNGRDWTVGRADQAPTLWAVTSGDRYLVAVGDHGAVLTSTNGLDWSARRAATTRRLVNVIYGDGSFIATSSDGTILQSDPLIRLRLEWNGQAKLAVSGPNGRYYRIDGTSELADSKNWQTLTTNYISGTSACWTDEQVANSSIRFYRAVLLP